MRQKHCKLSGTIASICPQNVYRKKTSLWLICTTKVRFIRRPPMKNLDGWEQKPPWNAVSWWLQTLVAAIFVQATFTFSLSTLGVPSKFAKAKTNFSLILPWDQKERAQALLTIKSFCECSMWTARCSYIRRLHPPNNYSNVLEFMYLRVLSQSKYACLRPINQSPNHLGLGRFAAERWSFSHPAVSPCDVVKHEGFVEPDFPQTWLPDFKKAPRNKARRSGIQFYKTSFAR